VNLPTQHSRRAHGLILTTSGGSTPTLRHSTRATLTVFICTISQSAHQHSTAPFHYYINLHTAAYAWSAYHYHSTYAGLYNEIKFNKMQIKLETKGINNCTHNTAFSGY